MLNAPHEEAIQEYIDALKATGKDPSSYVFEVKNDRIRMGLIDEGFTQWRMMWFTPDEFKRQAKRRRMNLQTGDPRKPDRQKFS